MPSQITKIIKNKRFYLLLRLTIGLVLAFMVWNPLVQFTYLVAKGQDPYFDLGHKYKMLGWPGYIVYWAAEPNDINFSQTRIIYPERTTEFVTTESWILGKTQKGWFAINKQNNELYYPLDSKMDIQSITGLDVLSLDFMTSYPASYEVVRQEAIKAKTYVNRLCWFMLFFLPLTLAFGPLLFSRYFRKIREGSSNQK